MEEHKCHQNNVSSQSLEWYAVEGDDYLHNLVMGNERRFYQFDVEAYPEVVSQNIAHEKNSKKCS